MPYNSRGSAISTGSNSNASATNNNNNNINTSGGYQFSYANTDGTASGEHSPAEAPQNCGRWCRGRCGYFCCANTQCCCCHCDIKAWWHGVKQTILLPTSHRFLSSLSWRIVLLIGNFILLFGSPLQMLLLPKGADPVMDVLYFLVLIVFLFDMIFRGIAVAGYFSIHAVKVYPGGSSSSKSSHKNSNSNKTHSSPLLWLVTCCGRLRCVQMGSFLFWCDLFSTLTLFYDISYTNPSYFSIEQLTLDLTRVGFIPGMNAQLINSSSPWEFNVSLLVTILKTARVVRFVRSQAVSTLIARVNWYWPLQKGSAILQALDCCEHVRRNFYTGRMEDDDHSYDNNGNGNNGGVPGTPSHVAPGMHHPGATGGGHHHHHHHPAGGPNGGHHYNHGKHRSRDDPLANSKSSNANSTVVEEYQNNGRSSWGRLGLATLAAVKAQRLAQEAEEEKHKGPFGQVVKFLRSIGLLGKDHTEWQRHLAATKIQRAWRRALARHNGEDHFFEHELGMMMGASGGGRSIKGVGGVGGSVLPNSWKSKSMMSKKSHQSSSSSKRLLPKSLRKMSIYPGIDPTTLSARISQKLKYASGGDHAAESQVGGAMRELTGQRVAIGILVALLLTATFTYVEQDATRPATMVILHAQTTGTRISPDGTTSISIPPPERWINLALTAARASSVPDMYKFEPANGNVMDFTVAENNDEKLRNRERLQITVESRNRTDPNESIMTSVGWFAYREERKNEALVQLFSTMFILLLWLFGVTAFAGPVMVLVVLPIERMVRLLGMLMVDPLGYQSTSRYKRFVAEEDEITKNTRWTKEVLKGMETSFLMSTILRIGSLMKVGFGSAGVEIIRKNLEREQGGKVNLLATKGLTVSCIFLFCDIRQFTDATECLQEEVFVFTNRIAAVVHSFCNSYGGSANKNVGDAFLCSWLLDEPPKDAAFGGGDQLYAKSNQADKCLLCVVKIIISLHHDNYYIESMSEAARQRLLTKLKKRPGPVVQMGCGLHAGKAVQGAIGSERKIDATYVSEAVNMSEFLESSTKKYGLKMLMSNSFHSLLHANNRQRCRLVDQIVIPNDEEENEDDLAIMYERDDIIELYTYDMDIDALWKAPPAATTKSAKDNSALDGGSMSDADSRQGHSDRRGEFKKGLSSQRGPSTRTRAGRRMSLTGRLTSKTAMNSSGTSAGGAAKLPLDSGSAHDFTGAGHDSAAFKVNGTPGSSYDPRENANGENNNFRAPELILPTGPSLYNPTIWRSEQMFRIRKKYLDGLFFHNYSQGLQSFYHREWDRATQSFKAILDTFEDGPSRYFLSEIEKNGGRPPPNFRPYGIA